MSALLKSKILPVVIQNKCDNARAKIIIYPVCTQTFLVLTNLPFKIQALPGVLENVSHMLAPLFPSFTAPSNYNTKYHMIIKLLFRIQK